MSRFLSEATPGQLTPLQVISTLLIAWCITFLGVYTTTTWLSRRRRNNYDTARNLRARERRIHAREHQLGLLPTEPCFPGCRLDPEKVTIRGAQP